MNGVAVAIVAVVDVSARADDGEEAVGFVDEAGEEAVGVVVAVGVAVFGGLQGQKEATLEALAQGPDGLHDVVDAHAATELAGLEALAKAGQVRANQSFAALPHVVSQRSWGLFEGPHQEAPQSRVLAHQTHLDAAPVLDAPKEVGGGAGHGVVKVPLQ